MLRKRYTINIVVGVNVHKSIVVGIAIGVGIARKAMRIHIKHSIVRGVLQKQYRISKGASDVNIT